MTSSTNTRCSDSLRDWINVACINPLSNPSQISKKSPQEVEQEVESDVLPAIISDSTRSGW
uniref:Uncharacterized protein n=1 Tax=Brassica oleracea TaxID=3712 RepID=A0A3P6B9A1_BRAOL|nr:unnamed protein product [Brassica oleracea]